MGRYTIHFRPTSQRRRQYFHTRPLSFARGLKAPCCYTLHPCFVGGFAIDSCLRRNTVNPRSALHKHIPSQIHLSHPRPWCEIARAQARSDPLLRPCPLPEEVLSFVDRAAFAGTHISRKTRFRNPCRCIGEGIEDRCGVGQRGAHAMAFLRNSVLSSGILFSHCTFVDAHRAVACLPRVSPFTRGCPRSDSARRREHPACRAPTRLGPAPPSVRRATLDRVRGAVFACGSSDVRGEAVARWDYAGSLRVGMQMWRHTSGRRAGFVGLRYGYVRVYGGTTAATRICAWSSWLSPPAPLGGPVIRDRRTGECECHRCGCKLPARTIMSQEQLIAKRVFVRFAAVTDFFLLVRVYVERQLGYFDMSCLWSASKWQKKTRLSADGAWLKAGARPNPLIFLTASWRVLYGWKAPPSPYVRPQWVTNVRPVSQEHSTYQIPIRRVSAPRPEQAHAMFSHTLVRHVCTHTSPPRAASRLEVVQRYSSRTGRNLRPESLS